MWVPFFEYKAYSIIFYRDVHYNFSTTCDLPCRLDRNYTFENVSVSLGYCFSFAILLWKGIFLHINYYNHYSTYHLNGKLEQFVSSQKFFHLPLLQ